MSNTGRACVMKIARDLFVKITSLEHLFNSWEHFRRGKRKRKDIQYFERHLEDRIFEIQKDIVNIQYRHGSYEHFYVTDPKQRFISKASVRDRLIHEAVYQVLNDLFEQTFIFHSLSSRLGKGTHFGVEHLRRMIRKASRNGKTFCYALKMDIKRFFDSVGHQILKQLIRKKVKDEKALVIIDEIIDSFHTIAGVGIPLGNVTSQLFANIYLHELDDFIKQRLREKFYLRYCDDFIILSEDRSHLESLVPFISEFLGSILHLELHPKKVILRKLSQGIDFIGYILFQSHTLLRTCTAKRMKKKLKEGYTKYLKREMDVETFDQKLQSYLGILSQANQHALSQALKNAYWMRSRKFKNFPASPVFSQKKLRTNQGPSFQDPRR